MKILILGATGFLGQHILSGLRAAGHTVISAGRSEEVTIRFDVLDPHSLATAIGETKPDAVINLLGAGLSDPHVDPALMERVNADFPASLLKALSTSRSSAHLIHASSSTEQTGVHGKYESEYSRTKAAGSQALLLAVDRDVTILRVHNTYGADQPAQRFVASVIDHCLRREPITLRFPDRVRDFIHVDDVSAAFVAATARSADGVHEWDVGTGSGTPLIDLARLVAAEAGADPQLITIDPQQDHHPMTVADRSLLARPATIDLQLGIRRVISERREGGSIT